MLREKLLKESRYSRLGLAGHEIEAMAARAVDEPLPTSVKSRNRELEKRLRIALDDRAAVLACVQRPPKVGLVTIHKLPTRRDRKELGYAYKRDKSSKPIPFSRLKFDAEMYDSVEEYVGHEVYWPEQKRGSESEQSRLEREEKDEALERAAESLHIAPVLESAKVCSGCGETIPGDARRFVDLRVEMPDGGVTISNVKVVSVQCEKCQVVQPTTEPVEDGSWMEKLTNNEREAIRLKNQGLDQTQIGKKMGKSQSTISRLLASAVGKQKAARAAKIRATGGA